MSVGFCLDLLAKNIVLRSCWKVVTKKLRFCSVPHETNIGWLKTLMLFGFGVKECFKILPKGREPFG